ncbi:MAG: hypothetical protein QNJ41_22755 [Xenococcaceae cyanobacterium MO_188.B32]|nr:hypothetical protein [Xenococcaceae cyanobacterium MO_188.B32]
MNNKQSCTIFRWAWCSEYGSPDNEEKFQTLLPYFPLHNLIKGTKYPAITTADRVMPAHSFKFAAALLLLILLIVLL